MPVRCAHCLSNAVTKLEEGSFECLHCGATGERMPKAPFRPPQDREERLLRAISTTGPVRDRSLQRPRPKAQGGVHR